MLTRERCKFNVSKVDRINGNHNRWEAINNSSLKTHQSYSVIPPYDTRS